jgi:hypothetical protein
MGTRSNQLAVHTFLAAGTLTLYTVPPLTRTVVKNIVCSNNGAGMANFLIAYIVPGGGVTIINRTAFGPAANLIQPTWDVLLAGNTIEAICTTPPVDIYISGAELLGP